MPPGEGADELLRVLTPWFDEARKRKAGRLRHGPAGAEARQQRSCLVWPLAVDGRLLGVIYADVEGHVGRFDTGQRRLLADLAAMAAAPLDKLQRLHSLERQADADALALQQAREQQRASADMLRVISASPTEVQPVFDAIVSAAVALMGCDTAFVVRVQGGHYALAALVDAQGRRESMSGTLVPIDAQTFPSRVVNDKRMLHIPDWSAIDLPPREQRVFERAASAPR